MLLVTYSLPTDIPLKKAVAGVRVGLLDSGLVINPTVEEMKVGTRGRAMGLGEGKQSSRSGTAWRLWSLGGSGEPGKGRPS